MTHIKWLRRSIVLLTTAGLLVPPGLDAGADEPTRKLTVHDVSMDRSGGLRVIVVNAQGHALPGAEITLSQVGEERGIRATTNADGRCVFQSLTGGSYSLRTSEGICLCRLWTAQAAPPKAADQLLIVNDRFVQRGQRPIHEMFYSDPILMTAIAVAAIAIPIAIHKSRDDSQPGS
jgi:hypothetical protein